MYPGVACFAIHVIFIFNTVMWNEVKNTPNSSGTYENVCVDLDTSAISKEAVTNVIERLEGNFD